MSEREKYEYKLVLFIGGIAVSLGLLIGRLSLGILGFLIVAGLFNTLFLVMLLPTKIRGYEVTRINNYLNFESDNKIISVDTIKFYEWKTECWDVINDFKHEQELCELIEKPMSLKWNKSKIDSLLQEDDVHEFLNIKYK